VTKPPDHPAPHPAAIFLRTYCDALLRVDDRLERVRYVVDPRSGSPVLPVLQDVLEAETVTLHIPDDGLEHSDALHILARPLTVDAGTHPAPDRYLICLGPPRQRGASAWMTLTSPTAKFRGQMVETAELFIPNPFAATEGRACSTTNKTPLALRPACDRAGFTPAQLPDPRLVGLDPWGADIRAPLGIVRVDWSGSPTASIEDSLRRLREG